jgi:prepilin peptidase CpaA
MEELRGLAVCVCSLTAAFFDLRCGKIPNGLIMLGLAAGLLFRLFYWGVLGGILFFGGIGVPILLLGPLFYFRMIGAGDIKLLAVLGGFLGGTGIGKCLLGSLFFGGFWSLVLMIFRKNLKARLNYFFCYTSAYLTTGIWRPYRNKGQKKGEFPFSVSVFLSVLCYVGGFY